MFQEGEPAYDYYALMGWFAVAAFISFTIGCLSWKIYSRTCRNKKWDPNCGQCTGDRFRRLHHVPEWVPDHLMREYEELNSEVEEQLIRQHRLNHPRAD